jgi:uncharacterized protein (DUF1501 family)
MAIDRRQFIRNTALGAVGMGLAEPLLSSRMGSLLAATGNRVVVVVNMFGGNDGLNTVIPLNQYTRYKKMRPTLAKRVQDVLPLSGQPDFGLNPGMAAFQSLFNQGRLAIINGVGVPREATGLFDHSAQQYEFQSCDIVRDGTALTAPTGWLGRYLDTVTPDIVAPGIDLGGGRLMLTGSAFDPLTIYSLSELQLQYSFDRTARRAAYPAVMSFPNANTVAEYNRLQRVNGLAQSDAIRNATLNYVPAVQYPDSYLARSLKECAKIISGDLGVYALTVGEGGFDTHSRQNAGGGPGVLGDHDLMLQNVADSVGAFYADLVAHNLSSRVLILTISEFGRTPWENSDDGSDHGFSSEAFALGDTVNGGIYGLYPGLDDQFLVFDDVTDMTTDFRSVYSTVLANFVGTDPVPLVGGSFPLLAFA